MKRNPNPYILSILVILGVKILNYADKERMSGVMSEMSIILIIKKKVWMNESTKKKKGSATEFCMIDYSIVANALLGIDMANKSNKVVSFISTTKWIFSAT